MANESEVAKLRSKASQLEAAGELEEAARIRKQIADLEGEEDAPQSEGFVGDDIDENVNDDDNNERDEKDDDDDEEDDDDDEEDDEDDEEDDDDDEEDDEDDEDEKDEEDDEEDKEEDDQGEDDQGEDDKKEDDQGEDDQGEGDKKEDDQGEGDQGEGDQGGDQSSQNDLPENQIEGPQDSEGTGQSGSGGEHAGDAAGNSSQAGQTAQGASEAGQGAGEAAQAAQGAGEAAQGAEAASTAGAEASAAASGGGAAAGGSAAATGGSAAATGGAAAGGVGIGAVLGIVLLIIVIIIILIGIIAFFLTMPGMVQGRISNFLNRSISWLKSNIYEDSATAFVTRKEVASIGDYLESMGYDLNGMGFLDQKVQKVMTAENHEWNWAQIGGWDQPAKLKYKNFSDDVTRTGSNIHLVYLAENESGGVGSEDTDVDDKELTNRIVMSRETSDTSAGTDPVTGYPVNTNATKVNEDGSIYFLNSPYIGTYLAANNASYYVRNYQKNLWTWISNIHKGEHASRGSGMIYFNDQPEGKAAAEECIVNINDFDESVVAISEAGTFWNKHDITVDMDAKLMSIKNSEDGLLNTSYTTYNLDGWVGAYGVPLQFSLALHLGHMAPDFSLAVAMQAAHETTVTLSLLEVKNNTSQIRLLLDLGDGEKLYTVEKDWKFKKHEKLDGSEDKYDTPEGAIANDDEDADRSGFGEEAGREEYTIQAERIENIQELRAKIEETYGTNGKIEGGSYYMNTVTVIFGEPVTTYTKIVNYDNLELFTQYMATHELIELDEANQMIKIKDTADATKLAEVKALFDEKVNNSVPESDIRWYYSNIYYSMDLWDLYTGSTLGSAMDVIRDIFNRVGEAISGYSWYAYRQYYRLVEVHEDGTLGDPYTFDYSSSDKFIYVGGADSYYGDDEGWFWNKAIPKELADELRQGTSMTDDDVRAAIRDTYSYNERGQNYTKYVPFIVSVTDHWYQELSFKNCYEWIPGTQTYDPFNYQGENEVLAELGNNRRARVYETTSGRIVQKENAKSSKKGDFLWGLLKDGNGNDRLYDIYSGEITNAKEGVINIADGALDTIAMLEAIKGEDAQMIIRMYKEFLELRCNIIVKDSKMTESKKELFDKVLVGQKGALLPEGDSSVYRVERPGFTEGFLENQPVSVPAKGEITYISSDTVCILIQDGSALDGYSILISGFDVDQSLQMNEIVSEGDIIGNTKVQDLQLTLRDPNNNIVHNKSEIIDQVQEEN